MNKYIYFCDCKESRPVKKGQKYIYGNMVQVEVDQDECCKLCGYQAVVQNANTSISKQEDDDYQLSVNFENYGIE